MGKPTGFMEYEREEARALSVSERICNYREFHEELSAEERKRQAARCMECGVPFCQSGMNIGGMIGEASSALQSQYSHLARIISTEVIAGAVFAMVIGGLLMTLAVKVRRKAA